MGFVSEHEKGIRVIFLVQEKSAEKNDAVTAASNAAAVTAQAEQKPGEPAKRKSNAGRKKGSPNSNLLEMQGAYDWTTDRWKVSIDLTQRALRLLDEFKVQPDEARGEGFKSYSDGADARQRYLVRRVLSQVGDMTGRSGIFFDKAKIADAKREVYFDGEEKAKDFISEVKTLFAVMQEQTVKMKRKFTVTLMVTDKPNAKPDGNAQNGNAQNGDATQNGKGKQEKKQGAASLIKSVIGDEKKE